MNVYKKVVDSETDSSFAPICVTLCVNSSGARRACMPQAQPQVAPNSTAQATGGTLARYPMPDAAVSRALGSYDPVHCTMH